MSEIYVGHFQLAAGALRDIDKAFDIVERARGRAMADALRDQQRPSVDAISEQSPAQKEITDLQRQLRETTTSGERARLLDDLDEAEGHLASSEYERHEFERLALSRPVALNDLRRSLAPDEVLLEYVLAEPHSFCLVVTRRGTTIQTLAGQGQIGSAIDGYLADLKARRPVDQRGKQLFSWLLGSCLARRSESNLIVVPDGKLNEIPFAALIDSEGRYVAQTHVVTMAPSSTVLYMLRQEVRPEAKYAFLGVGYAQAPPPGATTTQKVTGKLAAVVRGVFDLGNPTIEPLSYTDEEVKAAASDIGDPDVVLLGSNATEEKLKSEPLEDFAILHFAVHAITNVQEPERSALLFADGPHSKEDGLWQAREIRTLSLKADLVTLSACDTGIGRIEGEEGVDSLVGAFLMAGAKNVMASLWPANDRFTATLMEKFYAHLAHGTESASSLDRAELDILQQYGRETAPYYWAGFVLIGDGRGQIRFQGGKFNGAFKN